MTTMVNPVKEIVSGHDAVGIPPDFGPGRSRLLLGVLKRLACGRPVTRDQVDQIASDLDMSPDDAHGFLAKVCVRDNEGRILGCMGQSLNEQWAHHFYVNGTQLRTWCAWDSLFLPPLLERTASIFSYSPRDKKQVRVTVSPDRVEWSCPSEAVVSIVNIDGESQDASSIEGAWSSFCHQVYFFASREEAEAWAVDRDNVEILSLEEAYELGKRTFSKLLSYV